MIQTEPILAPRWRCLTALAYESLLILALLLVGGGIFSLLFSRFAGSQIEFVFVMGLVFGYFAYCWRKSGQTLSMKVWRLRVVSDDGSPMTWRQIGWRFGCGLIAFFPLAPAWAVAKYVPSYKWVMYAAYAWAILPYLWAWFDPKRKFLQDRLAKTKIIMVPIDRGADTPH